MKNDSVGTGMYYSGGLAELVASPSRLTHSYFAGWFCGAGSLGFAMKRLGLFYSKLSVPVVDLFEDELYVNLISEELTLYQGTIFSYKPQTDVHKTPQLKVDLVKLFNPLCLFHTLKILLIQSQWIAKPDAMVQKAQVLIGEIPEEPGSTLQEIDKVLQEKVWPGVLAVGILSEFYNQLILKEAKDKNTVIQAYISSKVFVRDWFFKSISDQKRVENGGMSFAEYIREYGTRADKDYELTFPRWHEMQDILKKRIQEYSEPTYEKTAELSDVSPSLKKLIETVITFQIMRSEAKKKALIHMDALRQAILSKTKSVQDIRNLSKQQIESGNVEQAVDVGKNQESSKTAQEFTLRSGKGICISQGEVEGEVKNILDNNAFIQKGTIGIFSNASPEFAVQFPKCTGMIFLRGGQTSHGAIVAREFGIPAVVDSSIKGIADGTKVRLNATEGEWIIL